MTTPVPANETERLEVVRRYRMILSAPEQALDDLTLVAAQLFKTSFAYIGLVDADRVWLKSRVGLAISDVPREGAFDTHAILELGPLVVKNPPGDPRFSAHPWVTSSPRILFYAAAPLVTLEGHALGTLVVMDRTPHEWSPEQEKALRALARLAMSQIQLAQKAASLEMTMAQEAPEGRELEAALTYADGMMEVALGPLLVLDADLGVVKGNQPFYETFGLVPDETDKRFVGEVIPNDKLLLLLQEILATGVSRRGVEIDHASKPLRVNAAKLEFEGGGIPLVVAAFDRRRGGPAPVADARAVAALEQMQDPAGRIASFTQILSMRFGDEAGEDAKRYLEEIVFASFKIQEVLRNYASKPSDSAQSKPAEAAPVRAPAPPPTAGPTPVRFDPPAPESKPSTILVGGMTVDLGGLFDDVVKELSSQIAASGAQVTHDDLPAVRGSRNELRAVLLHLVRNAIQYRSTEPPKIHAWAEPEPKEWTFSVTDNGIGIDPRRAELIFQGNRSLGRCREVIARHGGRLWVMSQPGNGATFYFTLPKA